MAVLKNKTKRDNFLVVSKIFLQDQRLSLMERGLLATMHSLPDDWEFTIMGMEKILPDGKYKIKVALDGLVKKGYVSKVQIKDSNGKFGRNVIEVNERPLTKIPLAEKPLTDNPLTGKPPAEISHNTIIIINTVLKNVIIINLSINLIQIQWTDRRILSIIKNLLQITSSWTGYWR